MKFIPLIIFLLPLMLFSIPAYATTTYVDSVCTDTPTTTYNPSTRLATGGGDTCYLTIQTGADSLSAGDILYIRAGTYAQTIGWISTSGPNGTSWANATTIAGYPGESVTLNPTTSSNISEINTYSSGTVKYIIFDNLIFDGTNLTGDGGAIYWSGPNTTYIRLSNSIVQHANACASDPAGAGQGITSYDSDHMQFINNHITDNGCNRLSHNMYVAGSNMLIEGNEIDLSEGYGIQLYWTANKTDNSIVRYNIIHDNHGDGGVVLDDNTTGTKIEFYNNLIYSNTSIGVQVGVCCGNNYSIKLYNNTIYGNGGTGIKVKGNSQNPEIKNNIVSNNTGWGLDIDAGVSNAVADKNTLYNNSSGSYRDNGTGSSITNTITTDPSMVSTATDDFQLTDSSNALDAGVTGLNDCIGICDKGAHEMPQIVSASIEDATPNIINVIVDVATWATPIQVTNGTGWTVSGASCSPTVSNAAANGSTQIDLTLSCEIRPKDTPKITYDSSSGNVKDTSNFGGIGVNSRLIGFTNQSVANNVIGGHMLGFGIKSID